MANQTNFHFTMVTPERPVLECDASFVAFPAHDGEVGIKTGRAPLLYRMGSGRLRVQSDDETHVYFVAGGFAQMDNNRLTLLTEQAITAVELDRAEAREALQAALAITATDDESYAAKTRAMDAARAQLRLAG